MESGRARGYRDDNRLPPLSLGLSSVRLIVNNLEAEYARAFASSSQLVKYDSSIEDDYDPPVDLSTSRVFHRFLVNLGVALSRCIPSVSFGNFAFLAVLAGYFAPTMISYLVLYPFCRLVFGTLYPAYASYKAVRTKNLKEYVKWMMYWIVFALFTCTETFTDVFLSWFPFYYEVKIVLVLWLLSPATKGSSILYRKFVHPALCRREQEIDEYIAKAKDQGYHTVLNLGTKGVNYATTVIMQTAIKGGGGLVQQLRKSYSLSDLSESVRDAGGDEADDVLAEPGVIRALTVRSGYNTRRSASESSRSPMYFPEVDVDVRTARSSRDEPDLTHIKSSEDISSGYSSADNSNVSLARTASVGGARPRARPGAKTSITTIKRPQAAEDSEVIIEELQDDDLDDYTSMPPLMNVPSPLFLSHSDPPFIYQYVGDQIRIVQVLASTSDPIKHINKTTEKIKQKDILNEAPTNINSPVVGDPIISQELTENNEYHNKVRIDNIGDTSLENHTLDADDKKVTQGLPQTDSNQNKIDSDITDDTFFESMDQNNNDNKSDLTNDNNTPHVILESAKGDLKAAVDANTLTINTETNKAENNCHITDPVKDNATETEIHPPSTDTKPNNEVKDEDLETTHLNTTLETTTLNTSLATTNSNTSVNEIDTAESDDEASFGTPENSPKSRRKSVKGRYGKGKAPPPPKSDIDSEVNNLDKTADIAFVTTSQESLVDIVKALPNTTFEEGRATSSLMVNPIAEKKRRHKSKSPGNIPKGNSSAIGKLLQLPAKFAFWNKNDNKSKGERDSMSISSGDRSRRSSTLGSDDCQISGEFHTVPVTVMENVANFEEVNKADDQISFKDASDFESEVITHDIMEKSDALQKLIEAKIESHPEYKYVLEESETPATSKSTETQV